MQKPEGLNPKPAELPKPLIDELTHGKIVIFLGPLFSAANGFKPIGEFLQELLKEHQAAWTSQQKTWLKEGKFHRVAQGCVNALENERFNFFEELKQEYARPLRMGPLYSLAFMLPAKAVISTNLDPLLKQFSSARFSSEQNSPNVFLLSQTEDRDTAMVFLKAKRPHAAFALGCAADTDSVTLPFARFNDNQALLAQYLHSALDSYTALFIGFDPMDAFVDWIGREILPQCTDRPRYFVNLDKKAGSIPGFTDLSAISSDETRQLDTITTKQQLVQNLLVTLLDQLGHNLTAENVRSAVNENPWIELTQEALDTDAKAQTSEHDFYRGDPAHWGDVEKNLDAKRAITDPLKAYLRTQRLRIALLTAPSGFGKTTVARRVAYDLWKMNNFRVFWVEDPLLFPPSLAEALPKDKDVLVVADHVQNLGDLHLWLQRWQDKGYKRLRFLLVGRKHEVLSGGLRLSAIRQACEFKEFSLPWITADEARHFIAKLRENDRLPGPDSEIEDQVKTFTVTAQGDLLAGLLITQEKGKSLEDIVSNVCERVLTWPRGRILLFAYATVAAIDRLAERPEDRTFQCTGRLFHKIMQQQIGEKEQDTYSILNLLPGELKLAIDREVLRTRHPRIAEAACKALFNKKGITGVNGSLFNENDFYQTIVGAAGEIGQFPELRLTSTIPLYFQRKNDFSAARKLFETAHKVLPKDAVILQTWARMEERQGRIEEARKLFKKGTQVDPNNAPSWQAWALLEERQGRIEEARKLFEKGTQADPKHAPSWQAWALLEERQGRIEEARELFKKGTQADPKHAPSWQAWALLEERRGRIEEARKLFEKGTQADPKHAPSWQAWVEMEDRSVSRDKAIGLATKGLKHSPNDRYLAETLERLKKGLPSPSIKTPSEGLEKLKKKQRSSKEPTDSIFLESPVSSLLFAQSTVTQGMSFEQERILAYLLGGLAVRLDLPVVLMQFPQGEPAPIYPVEAPLNYPNFCKHLLGTYELRHWENHPCRENMRERAMKAWETFQTGQRALDEPLILTCHIGVSSLYMPFILQEKLVGMLLVGKFLLEKPRKDVKDILNAEEADNILAKARHEAMARFGKESQEALENAGWQLKELSTSSEIKEAFKTFSYPEIRYRFHTQIIPGTSRIQKAVTLMHQSQRDQGGDQMLADHRLNTPASTSQPLSDARLREALCASLKQFAQNLGAAYAAFFVAVEAGGRYLHPVAMGGAGDGGTCQFKAYIDRYGADIPDQMLRPQDWRFNTREQDFREQALCGTDKTSFLTTSLAVGFSHLGHPGILCLGPFSEEQTVIEEGMSFLSKLCFRFGIHLAGHYITNLYRLGREQNEMAFHFAVHGIKNGLHLANARVETLLGKLQTNKLETSPTEKLQIIHDEVMTLSENAELALYKPLSSLLENKDKLTAYRASSLSEATSYLSPLVLDIIDAFQEQANEKTIRLVRAEDRTSGVIVAVDPFLVKEAVTCLVDNAIKYGQQNGKIIINWHENNGMARISVSGAGQAMTVEKENTVFEKGNGKNPVGSGFGLYLVRAAARSWGGEAGQESSEIPDLADYKNYEFWFTIPTE